jgi:tRNA(fMet)-specific endonuclease VapC
MRGGNGVLDTNAVIQILNGRLDPAKLGFDKIMVPMTVIGELFFGVHKSGHIEKNRERLFSFLDLVKVLKAEIEVAEEYGRIKTRLRQAGRPIPENDMWIAATAIANQVPVVTNDKRFTYIAGLEVIRY